MFFINIQQQIFDQNKYLLLFSNYCFSCLTHKRVHFMKDLVNGDFKLIFCKIETFRFIIYLNMIFIYLKTDILYSAILLSVKH